jgi:replicative DNA helicase
MDPIKGRVPPQNLEAEMHLLGALLIRPEVLHDILTFLNDKHFYAEKHRIIFKHILELMEKNEPIDLVTVSSKLRDSKSLDPIGGIDYLTEIAGSVGTSASAEYFAKEIYKKAMLRDLIRASNKIGEFGYDEISELDATLEKAEKEIYDITQKMGNTGEQFVEIKNTLEHAWARIERMHERKGELRGVTTGFKDLDNLLSGWQKQDLIILAARPSVGKSSLALDFVRAAAVRAKHGVAFFSLEMSKEQLVDRMVSAESKVNSWKLRTGSKLYDNEWGMIQEGLNRLREAKIFLDDEPAITPIKMKSKLRKMNSRHKIDLVIVDYLQLMSSHKHYDNMVNQVTEISRSLKGIAKEFNVPVIALSQLSRAVETRGGKPKLSDLRDSGSIEQDADVVMFIHREDYQKSAADRDNSGAPAEAEILIEKHRNGPTGYVKLHFDKEKTTFVNIDRSFGEFANVPGNIPEANVSAIEEF